MAPGVASLPETNREEPALVTANKGFNANGAGTSRDALTSGRAAALTEQKWEVGAEMVAVRASAACKRRNVLRADGCRKKMEAL